MITLDPRWNMTKPQHPSVKKNISTKPTAPKSVKKLHDQLIAKKKK